MHSNEQRGQHFLSFFFIFCYFYYFCESTTTLQAHKSTIHPLICGHTPMYAHKLSGRLFPVPFFSNHSFVLFSWSTCSNAMSMLLADVVFSFPPIQLLSDSLLCESSWQNAVIRKKMDIYSLKQARHVCHFSGRDWWTRRRQSDTVDGDISK